MCVAFGMEAFLGLPPSPARSEHPPSPRLPPGQAQPHPPPAPSADTTPRPPRTRSTPSQPAPPPTHSEWPRAAGPRPGQGQEEPRTLRAALPLLVCSVSRAEAVGNAGSARAAQLSHALAPDGRKASGAPGPGRAGTDRQTDGAPHGQQPRGEGCALRGAALLVQVTRGKLARDCAAHGPGSRQQRGRHGAQAQAPAGRHGRARSLSSPGGLRTGLWGQASGDHRGLPEVRRSLVPHPRTDLSLHKTLRYQERDGRTTVSSPEGDAAGPSPASPGPPCPPGRSHCRWEPRATPGTAWDPPTDGQATWGPEVRPRLHSHEGSQGGGGGGREGGGREERSKSPQAEASGRPAVRVREGGSCGGSGGRLGA